MLGLEPRGADPEDRPATRDVVKRVAILAMSAGLRNVFAPTISPIRTRSVVAAQAVIASQPSKIGPSWLPTIG